MRSVLFVLLLTSGCGASSEPAPNTTPSSHKPSEPTPNTAHKPIATSGDHAATPVAMICANDADCMVGSPRDCCTSFCGEDRVAWSRAAWADYQSMCRVTRCDGYERLACSGEAGPAPTAACVEGQCVLRR